MTGWGTVMAFGAWGIGGGAIRVWGWGEGGSRGNFLD